MLSVRSSTYRIIVWDLETTGLSPYHDDIIEIAAQDNTGRTYATLVETKKELSPLIQKLTGITPLDLEGKPSITQALRGFMNFIAMDVSKPILLLGHNTHKFDLLFLGQACLQNQVSLPTNAVVHWMDTLLISQMMYPNLKSHSLKALCETFHIAQCGAHRALEDVITTMVLFGYLLRSITKHNGLRGENEDEAIAFVRKTMFMGTFH